MIGLGKTVWEMEKLKEKLNTLPVWFGGFRRLRAAFLRHPLLQSAGKCLCRFAMCFLLSSVAAGGKPVPLAPCLLAVSGPGFPGLFALFGCLAGYIQAFGLLGSLEPLAASLLIYSANLTFRDLDARALRWFLPAVCACLNGLVGLLYLLDNRFRPHAAVVFLAKELTVFAGVWVFRAALEKKQGLCLVFFISCLTAGLARFSLFSLSLGVAAGVWVCTCALGGELALEFAAGIGLALDLALPTSLPLAGLLPFSCLLVRALPLKSRAPQSACFCLFSIGADLFLGGVEPEILTALLMGAALSLPVPPPAILVPRPAQAQLAPLRQASDTFSVLCRQLSAAPAQEPELKPALVFDRAAEQVCRLCALYGACWEQHASQSYRCLCAAAAPMARRGKLLPQDLTDEFSGRCRHLDAFVAAVNQELDQQLLQRQFQNRLQTYRDVFCQQLRLWSDLFASRLRTSGQAPETETRYLPRLSVASSAKPGNAVSGDRILSFCTGQDRYWVLLCDGMGSGPEAAGESAEACQLLRQLLQAGLSAPDALQSLNSLYLLRGDGEFSTVDLLEADLATGQACLYKWGAAPSYLRSGSVVRKLGAGSPPPGLETDGLEQLRFSLEENETLVLLSDGIGQETAQRCLLQAGANQDALADELVAEARETGDDDMSAAVLSLLPV